MENENLIANIQNKIYTVRGVHGPSHLSDDIPVDFIMGKDMGVKDFVLF
jgi:hypothetical protein